MRVNPVQNISYTPFSNKSCDKKQEAKLPYVTTSDNPINWPVPFTGTKKDSQDRMKMREMDRNFTPESESLFERGKSLAKKYGNDEIETWHLYLASLYEVKKYIKELDDGIIKPNEETRLRLPYAVEGLISENDNSFANKKARAKISTVVDEHIKQTIQNFAADPKNKSPQKAPRLSNPQPSKNTIDDLYDSYNMGKTLTQSELFYDNYFYSAAVTSKNRKLAREAISFSFDLQKELMVSSSYKKEKHHLSFYDDKADAIWKNIALGNDVISRYDKDDPGSSKHLISSFTNLINKPGQKYKGIDPEKTDIYVLNDYATFGFLNELENEVKTAPPDKDRTTVVVADLTKLFTSCGGELMPEDIQTLKNAQVKDRNMHFVFTMDTGTYLANMAANNGLNQILSKYSLQTLPSLNAADAKKYLTDENGMKFIEKETNRVFPKETVLKAIELTTLEDGNYPDKATALLSGASKYYIDKDEITPEDVEKYTKETKGLSETQAEQSDIVFDTGKRLSDIVGSPMTKADAESIVKQIKTKKIGTKGFRAFLEDGSSYGGGRRHTAEAIAGEAGIPMITINAKDFALKDIDALSMNAGLSELKIKKIVSSAIAQAEVNENKTAMIFIENFDNFASNPLYGVSSIYEQKAFSQLLSEMDNARKNKDVNLVVVGSVNMPELIDPNIMKPYKFLNSILVYPPQDTEQRTEVLNYYVEKMGLEIQDEETIKNIAETTAGFTVVDIMYLLETVDRVSKERNKDKIDSSDFTEAYLQTVTGRANTAFIPDSKKKIVTSHEAGHALCLQVMYDMAEKQQIPWHLPDVVNFITLDPRGEFGGAMFHKSSENEEINFEKIMSDMVCSYGGHSAEKSIYNMTGSYGITADMQSIDGIARFAVMDMGMGPKTGVDHIKRKEDGSADVSEKKLEIIESDIDSFKKSALYISDSILEAYQGFILEFTDKYWQKVGTGECIISGKEFKEELNNWREKQPDDKKQELGTLEKNILSVMESTKKGKKPFFEDEA
ncbi:MAG: AAA family ATPase [Candidatus Gastranaerophilales bacterium]|nr:AAA family ATPase [Candidatus Gastranaerophilales bacterium]